MFGLKSMSYRICFIIFLGILYFTHMISNLYGYIITLGGDYRLLVYSNTLNIPYDFNSEFF